MTRKSKLFGRASDSRPPIVATKRQQVRPALLQHESWGSASGMSDLIFAQAQLEHVRNSAARIREVDNGRIGVIALDSKSRDAQMIFTEKDRLNLRFRSLCGDVQVGSGPNCKTHSCQDNERNENDRTG